MREHPQSVSVPPSCHISTSSNTLIAILHLSTRCPPGRFLLCSTPDCHGQLHTCSYFILIWIIVTWPTPPTLSLVSTLPHQPSRYLTDLFLLLIHPCWVFAFFLCACICVWYLSTSLPARYFYSISHKSSF